jgi:hypothetical protein
LGAWDMSVSLKGKDKDTFLRVDKEHDEKVSNYARSRNLKKKEATHLLIDKALEKSLRPEKDNRTIQNKINDIVKKIKDNITGNDIVNFTREVEKALVIPLCYYRSIDENGKFSCDCRGIGMFECVNRQARFLHNGNSCRPLWWEKKGIKIPFKPIIDITPKSQILRPVTIQQNTYI